MEADSRVTSPDAEKAREKATTRAERKVRSAIAGLRVAEEDIHQLARDLDTMRSRTPPTGRAHPDPRMDIQPCEACGLHPYDITAGEYEDELKRLDAALAAERAHAEKLEEAWVAVDDELTAILREADSARARMDWPTVLKPHETARRLRDVYREALASFRAGHDTAERTRA